MESLLSLGRPDQTGWPMGAASGRACPRRDKPGGSPHPTALTSGGLSTKNRRSSPAGGRGIPGPRTE